MQNDSLHQCTVCNMQKMLKDSYLKCLLQRAGLPENISNEACSLKNYM